LVTNKQDRDGPVKLKILGKEYRIACAPEHKQGLENSANLLNNKMSEIRASGKVIGNDRIAVMAALNLTHELLEQQQNNNHPQFQQKLHQLTHKINKAMTDYSKS
jgi:cell division protein ZapA